MHERGFSHVLPEMTWLGGPPERSEGGEGHRMVGPLRAQWRKTVSLQNLISLKKPYLTKKTLSH